MTLEELRCLWKEHSVGNVTIGYSEEQREEAYGWFVMGVLASASHEREECAKVAEREEKAYAEFSREAEVVPGGEGFRLYHKHLQGREVARAVKEAIRARGDPARIDEHGMVETGFEEDKPAHKPLKVGPCCAPRDTLKAVLVDKPAPSEDEPIRVHCPNAAEKVRKIERDLCDGMSSDAASEDEGKKLAERLWAIMRKFGGHPMPTRDWIQVASLFRDECVAPYERLVDAASTWVWYNGKEDFEVYEVRALCKAVHALPDQGEPPKNKFPWADGHLAKWVAETTVEERREWISRAMESLPDDMRELMNLPEDKPPVSDEESGVRIVVKVLVDADGEVHAGVESAERHPREARPWR